MYGIYCWLTKHHLSHSPPLTETHVSTVLNVFPSQCSSLRMTQNFGIWADDLLAITRHIAPFNHKK